MSELDDGKRRTRRPPIRNRGVSENPANRFVELHVEPTAEALAETVASDARVATRYLRDTSRSIISRNNSPDVGFEASLNPYRGCEHGCAYCYARPTHEYLGFSAGLDFESRILVKENAPTLLDRELASPRWRPQVLALSGVTDAYQPIEGRFRLTRACLEVLSRYRNPVCVVTKNHLVRRDADLLAELAQFDSAAVFVSITTLKASLYRTLEPRTCHPQRRLEAIHALAEAGVPVGVLVAPVIPALNDAEIPAILEAARENGASHAGQILLRLPGPVAPLFEQWLEDHFPDRKDKVLQRVRATRGGHLNDSRFGHRMRGEGIFAQQIRALFEQTARRLGMNAGKMPLSADHFRNPHGQQLTFFDD